MQIEVPPTERTMPKPDGDRRGPPNKKGRAGLHRMQAGPARPGVTAQRNNKDERQ